jgi:L-amino acid N-acyltransferase YncA/8-oxo-dGTP pyrophosphatase MutT (NUDIX family)
MADAKSGSPIIRPATDDDADAIWRIFHSVVATGDTYAFAEDTPKEAAVEYFLAPDVVAFVSEVEGRVVGMYKVIPNRLGRGSHVANASFMVDPRHKGRGIGWALGRHCLAEAWARGYLSMQFNFVVSTNTAAVRLWQSLGFAVVGTLPGAFRHRDLGDVDALVMYRSLDDPNVGAATDIPLFGERGPDARVVVRPSAYLIVPDDDGRIAVVNTGEGVFLPGGGVDTGESAADAARRETREECAIDVRIEEEVGRARDMVWSKTETTCFEKRCVFFSGTLLARTSQTPEHDVRWLNPDDAFRQIGRSGHAWALRRWTERSSTGL